MRNCSLMSRTTYGRYVEYVQKLGHEVPGSIRSCDRFIRLCISSTPWRKVADRHLLGDRDCAIIRTFLADHPDLAKASGRSLNSHPFRFHMLGYSRMDKYNTLVISNL